MFCSRIYCPEISSSIMLAPGCWAEPFLTSLLSLSKLALQTLSGKVSLRAIKTGTPIWSVVILGSGEMTERPPKLTRLPIIFILNMPSLRSRSCLTPGYALSAVFYAMEESMKILTESYSWIHFCVAWLFTAVLTPVSRTFRYSMRASERAMFFCRTFVSMAEWVWR